MVNAMVLKVISELKLVSRLDFSRRFSPDYSRVPAMSSVLTDGVWQGDRLFQVHVG